MKDPLALNLTICVFLLGTIIYLRIRSRYGDSGEYDFGAASVSVDGPFESTVSRIHESPSAGEFEFGHARNAVHDMGMSHGGEYDIAARLLAGLSSGFDSGVATRLDGMDEESLVSVLERSPSSLARPAKEYLIGRLSKSDEDSSVSALLTLAGDSNGVIADMAAKAFSMRKSVARRRFLVETLESDIPEETLLTVIRLCESFNGEELVDPLVKCLSRPGKIAEAAASALGATGSSRAVEPLVNYLKALDEELESHLRGMVPVTAPPELLMHRRPGYQGSAPMLEGSSIEDPERLLVEALTDDPNGTLGKSHVIPLMRTLSDDNLPQEIRYQAATALGRLNAEVARDQLITSLDDMADAVRYGSIQALASMGDRGAAKEIAARLRDSNEFVRSAAAHALGVIGDSEVLNELLLSCMDTSKTVRFSALRSAVDIDLSGSKEAVLAGLKDVDDEIRLIAVRAAGSLRSTESLEPLIDLLRQSDGELRNACAEALFELEDPRAIEPLIDMLRDIDDDLMRMAGVSIKSEIETDRIAVPLSEAIVSGNDSQAFISTARMSSPDHSGHGMEVDIEALDKALVSDSVYVSGAAILTIAQVLEPLRALDRLERMITHKASYIRESVAISIGNMISRGGPSNPNSEPRFLQLLEKLSKDKSSEVRYAVAKSLGKARSLSTLKVLKKLSTDKSEFVANAAKQAIEETGDKARSEKRIFIGHEMVRELLPM